MNEAASSLPPSPYLTAAEAAAYLRTTLQGVYGLVKRARVKPMPGRPGACCSGGRTWTST